MENLRAVKIFFINSISNDREGLGSNGFSDKMEKQNYSTASDTSSESLETGFAKTGEKPGLCRRLTEYARGRKASFVAWSFSQSRSVWASIILAFSGTIIILCVDPPVYHVAGKMQTKMMTDI